MANRIPLVVDSSNYRIEEIPVGDTLDLSSTTITNINVSGITTVSAGSSSVPSITPTGDSNTGIFFPSNDITAVSVGGTQITRFIKTTEANILEITSPSSAGVSSSSGRSRLVFTNNSNQTSALIESDTNTPVGIASTTNLGRLIFSTTDDGHDNAAMAGVTSERMRILADGVVCIGKTLPTITRDGNYLYGGGASFTKSGYAVLDVARLVDDGDLVRFWSSSAPGVVNQQGTISVTGSTVSYNGGHLARWSQLPNSEDPSTILKGTVLSNLDEMCEWGDEDNEQLNRMKISNVEGDKNVSGVFVATSFSEDGPLDFYCAMTGDFIIRIAAGVTVQRGDLLMSAGDGTAKPQKNGSVQDKTVGKVTSTHVTCTYDDGSYCVPCVLMAC